MEDGFFWFSNFNDQIDKTLQRENKNRHVCRHYSTGVSLCYALKLGDFACKCNGQ